MPEKRWSDLSKREKLDLLGEALKPSERAAVMARVEKHFRGRTMDDFPYATNVVLREAWRNEHGDTTEWDRVAGSTAGVIIR